MFSKEEAKKLREEFWTSFGKEYPRKWILYDTRIKEIQLKFSFTSEVAQVSLNISSSDELIREYYWDKILSLKNILLKEYLPDAIYDENHLLPEDKEVSRVYVEFNMVNIYRKKDWPMVQEFFYDRMELLEIFFLEYRDIIES